MRPAVRFDHAEIGEHKGGGLGLHRATAIRMQRQLVGRHGMFCHGVLEECFELNGTFRMLDAPADDAAADDVEDDVEIEVRPFDRPHQFGDVPGPHLIGGTGQQFGRLIDRVATLTAALCNLTMGGKDAIHRADGTQIDAFIEQGRINLRRGLVGESGCAQMGKHLTPLTFRQGSH